MSPPTDFSHLQDVMSSLPMLKRYMVLTLFFPLRETQPSIPEVTSTLTSALGKLAEAFPFLTGRVIYEGRDRGSSELVKIVPHQDNIQLIVKDVRDKPDAPNMAEMARAKYPFSMLKPDSLVPQIGVSWSTDGFDEIAPVLILQANFVKGGVALTFVGNHTTMDMTGLGMVIAWFAKACRHEPFTTEEVQQANQDRRNAVSLLDRDWQPGPELDDVIVKPVGRSARGPARWAYFNISATNLARLKTEASKQEVVQYISTDDAISALCWQAVAKAHLPLPAGQTSSQFCRDVSVRKHFGLKGYVGCMTDCLFEREVDVWDRPLGEMAGRLRRLVSQDEKIASHFRGFVTLLDRLGDKSAVTYGANLDFERDVVISSYANIGCCELSFGPVLGVPDAVRRPDGPVFASGLCFVLPKARDGSVAVGLSTTDEELARLRGDAGFASFAEYVG